ncbi:hypothetical protein DH2020_031369 [Rehmannia glutinosa]|uniref:Protein SIEVE ELEMENT OCCLUSION B-like n=1 Tax=Rehmannia glutinosa TaxID=99300 RepID=A0ABR0VI53_REHGL
MADRRTRDPQTLVWSDDNAVMKTIQATHGLDDFAFKIRPLLLDIRDKRTGFLNEIDLGDISMQEKLVLEINNISWEVKSIHASNVVEMLPIGGILSNCGDGENMHKTVLDVFNALSSFFWAGKAVIALAAFAVNYGEFWLVKQLQSTNPVAQSLAFLEQLQPEMEQKLMFQNMDTLIKAVLNLTKCICESVDVQSNNYLKPDLPELKSMMAKIPEYTYWIIRSIVTCQTQLSNLNAYEYTSSSIEALNVSILVDKVTGFSDSMRTQLDLCYQQAEENRNVDVYGKLKKLLEVTSNKDNVMILKALISDQEETPLYDGHTNTQVRIEDLGNKMVLLYLSELKQSCSLELSVLSEMYLTTGQKPKEYEIVWIPVIEEKSLANPEKKKLFKEVQNTMPWLSLRDLSLLDPAVVKYIKDDWQFQRRSMIKVVYQQGRLSKNHDAMHMVFIWGCLAEPFSRKKEKDLWEKENWSVDLLLNNIETSAIEWALEGKFICLYGGEDTVWIQNFTTVVSDIFQQSQVPIMTLYLGTNDMNAIVEQKKYSNIILDPMKIKLFWARLESIRQSRVQIGVLPESDEIIKEVFKMLSFGCSKRGWAIISKGSNEMAKGMGDIMLKALSEYDQWKGNVELKGFVTALEEYMGTIGTSYFCNKFIVPKTKNGLPEKMDCFECRREMRMSVRFTCCGD